MEDELKKKIAKEIFEGYTGLPWPPIDEYKHTGEAAYKHADSILSLIDAERCVWTEETRSNGVIVYKTSCGKQAVTWDQKDFNENPFCQACGRKIEVKDGQG